MKACKHCWRVNLQDAKKCVGCGATEFLDIIGIEKEGNMNIKHWNCWMWGARRLDTRLAIDFGRFTLYVGGFSNKDISSD